MPDLKQWQESFLGAVQGKDAFRSNMQELVIKPYYPRIDIYADCSHETFVQALRLSYPHTLQLLGEECFYGLASDFVNSPFLEQHGVSENSLDDFGVQLPEFLPQWLSDHNIDGLDYLSQLSTLDWLIQQAYHAADTSVFNLAAYGELTEDSQNIVCFELAPSIQLMASDWPLKAIVDWHELGADTALDIQPSKEYYLIWRQQWLPKIEVLNQGQYQLLLAIQQGQNLAELAQGESQNELGNLSGWIQQGWISGFYLASSNNLNHILNDQV